MLKLQNNFHENYFLILYSQIKPTLLQLVYLFSIMQLLKFSILEETDNIAQKLKIIHVSLIKRLVPLSIKIK